MHRMYALAKFEFVSNLNFRADLISLTAILTVIFLRFWTVDVIQENAPAKLGFFLPENSDIRSDISTMKKELEQVTVSSNIDELELLLQEGKLDGYIKVCLKCEIPLLTIISVSDFDSKNYIDDVASRLAERIFPMQYSLSDKDYLIIKSGFKVEYQNKLNIDNGNGDVLTTVFMFLACISILSAFALLFQGITLEKEEKITEMYMSCMHVHEWVDGKVLAALGITLKGLVIYYFFAVVGMVAFEFVNFTSNELYYFLSNKALLLLFSFSLGFIFWCYLFAFISVIIDKKSTSIKNAVVILPMSCFGIIVSISDYVSNEFYQIFCYIPITYIFAVPSKIMSSDYDFYHMLAFSLVTLISTYMIRRMTYKYLKFC